MRRARGLAERAYRAFLHHARAERAAEAAELIASSLDAQGAHADAYAAAELIDAAARASGDPLLEAKALVTRALASRFLGRLEESWEKLARARELYAGARAVAGLARVAAAQADLHLDLIQDRTAFVVAREGLRLAEPLADPSLEMWLRLRLGQALVRLGRKEGLAQLQRALELLPTAAGVSPGFFVFLSLSEAHLLLEQPEQSLVYAREALECGRRLGNRGWMNGAYLREGRSWLRLGDERAAEASFRAAAAHPVGRRRAGRAYFWLGRVHERRGQLEPALAYYEAAVAVFDDLLRQRAAEEDRLSRLRGHQQAYRAACQALVRLYARSGGRGRDHAREAFLASERLRNRLFMDDYSAAQQNLDAIPPDLEARLAAVLERKSRLLQRLAQGAETGEARPRESLQLLEVEEQGIRREAAIRQSRPARATAESWPPERVQELLGPATAFVEYAATDPPAAFVLTRDRFELVPLPQARPLESRVTAYLELLNGGRGPGLDAFATGAGFELYRDLVEPALAVLPGSVSQLIVAPDAVLLKLPFEALPTRKEGRFLLEDYSISYLPSASSLSLVRDALAPAGARSLLAFADPAFSRDGAASFERSLIDSEDLALGALPHSKAEVQGAAHILGLARSDVFTGEDASEERLKTMDLTPYRILHFATHGFVSANHPWSAALLLAHGPAGAEDGFLQVREIHDLRLSADLVVLSACRTGQGISTPAEGMQSLSRAFFFAGARSLLASLWKVEDEASAKLMVAFYGYVRRGLSTAESLRRAKTDLLRSGRFHPKQWAAFVLFGEGGRPVPLPADDAVAGSPLAGGGLAALLLAGLLALRARRARL
jgi:CHAT domain-containing protein